MDSSYRVGSVTDHSWSGTANSITTNCSWDKSLRPNENISSDRRFTFLPVGLENKSCIFLYWESWSNSGGISNLVGYREEKTIEIANDQHSIYFNVLRLIY